MLDNNMDSDLAKENGPARKDGLSAGRFGGLLGLFIFAAFPKVLLGLHSFFYRDYGVLGYPFVFYHHQSFWRGELPLWNPLSNCGAPFLAQWGTMTLYPFSLIYLIFPLPWSLTYFCFAHLFLGGLGMYFLADRWTRSRFAASVAGLAYVFNGVTFSCLLWPNYIVALGWMPWTVLWVERGWREGGRWIVIATVGAALQMLAGVPEIVLLTWVLLGAIWMDEMVQMRNTRKHLLRRLALIVLLASGLTAVQLLPFFDLLAHSQRDWNFVTSKWAMPAWGWANLLVPLFHSFKTYQGPFFIRGQEFMSSYYLGIGVLLLAIWAVWRVRCRRVWLLGALSLLSLLMALGENGFLFVWLKRMIPLMGVARFPIKFVVLAAFTVPLLAAFALSKLPEPGAALTSRRRSLLVLYAGALGLMVLILWFARTHPSPLEQWNVTWKNAAGRAIFLTLMIGALYHLPRFAHGNVRTALQSGILVFLFLDVLTHTAQQNPSIPTSAFATGLWQEQGQVLTPKLGESRAMISPAAEKHLLRNSIRNPLEEFVGKRLALWSNLNLLDEIPKVNGSSTLQLREQKQVESLLYNEMKQLPSGLISFLGVSQLTASNSMVEWSARTNYCPMVTCGQKPIFDTATNILSALVTPEFDPREVVYLPIEARSFVTVSNQTACRIISRHFSTHGLEVETECKEPSLVVISQSFYHPWRAEIDGRSISLWRANYAFQALQVPSGRHLVRLSYRDRNLELGAIVSTVTLAFCLLFWFRDRGTKTKRLEECSSSLASI